MGPTKRGAVKSASPPSPPTSLSPTTSPPRSLTLNNAGRHGACKQCRLVSPPRGKGCATDKLNSNGGKQPQRTDAKPGNENESTAEESWLAAREQEVFSDGEDDLHGQRLEVSVGRKASGDLQRVISHGDDGLHGTDGGVRGKHDSVASDAGAARGRGGGAREAGKAISGGTKMAASGRGAGETVSGRSVVNRSSELTAAQSKASGEAGSCKRRSLKTSKALTPLVTKVRGKLYVKCWI